MMDILRQNAQSWGIKIAFGIIIAVFIFAFGAGGFNGNTDPVIAYVNDQPVPTQEFMQVYRETAEALRAQNPTIDSDQLQAPEFKKAVLEQLVSKKLLEAEALKLGLSVSNSELSYGIRQIPAFADQDGKFDMNLYQAFLQSRQMSAATFENDMRNSALIQKLQEYVTLPVKPTEAEARALFDSASEKVQIDYYYVSGADFVKNMKISDKEIEDFYKANPDKFTIPGRAIVKYIAFTPEELSINETVTPEEINAYYAANKESFQQEEQLKARHILIAVDENAAEKDVAAAEKKIKKVLAKAKSGQDFGKLAKKYSEGPSSSKGGELGWFGHGAMVKPFEDAAFALKKGEVSKPVRTRFGWHLIKIDDVREAGQKKLDQVKDEISSMIAQEKAADSITDKLDHAIDLLASGLKLDKVSEEIGVAFKKSEQATVQNLSRAFGMTESAAQTIIALPKGSATEMPVAIDGGYILVEKEEDVPPTLSPLKDQKQDIESFLSQQKAMQLARVKAMAIRAKLADQKTAAKELKSIKKDLKTSEPFGRDGFVPGLGMNPKLAQAAFATKQDQWMSDVFELPGGFIVARVDDRIPPKEEAWETQKEMVMNALFQQRANEVFNAFLAELRSKAQVEYVRKDLLN
ncbi:peptidylprolyl isomerase [Desulfovibrio sp. JC022]|uniref:peptidylprolyl isomerase n=1 Tax=Desulfovibrio sp. JC022 TaxID=2593642 RepID=UPI0013D8C853|nr:peptidylprolyl isomerase [Desulfovibrio sp. JC022]NDV23869.1 peptidylprolyl isomerase [Desulfovibrio sp. JC022]